MSPKTDKIDELSKQLEENIERGVTNWVYNDQFFNFLRTTPARWMLALVAVGTLYGYGVYAWITEGITGYVYPVLIFGAVLLHDALCGCPRYESTGKQNKAKNSAHSAPRSVPVHTRPVI